MVHNFTNVAVRSSGRPGRWLSASVAAGLITALAACGSSSGDPSAGNDADGDVAEAVGGAPATAAAASGGESSATVIVGDRTYEFTAGAYTVCGFDGDGLLRAEFAGADGSSASFSMPPEGYTTDDPLFYADQYPSVVVGLDDAAWSANAYDSDPLSVNNRNLPAGQSVVLEYEADASGASGTANFVDLDALEPAADGTLTGESVAGSFIVIC